MQKLLRITVLTIACSLMFFSCVSDDEQEQDRGRRGPQNMSEGRQARPQPSETEISLMRLQSFINGAASTDLTISPEQAEKILPILEDWKKALEADSKTDGTVFADNISKHLTPIQNSYQPAPPEGGPDSREKPGPQDGQQGGPGGEFPALEILNQIIEALQ